jgi:branched-chain amino acid transport system permease protein
MKKVKKKSDYLLLKVVTILGVITFIFIAQRSFDAYIIRILNLCGIYVILGVSLNLINGFTGQFSLGHAGFMSIGAYASALLYMSPELKEVNFCNLQSITNGPLGLKGLPSYTNLWWTWGVAILTIWFIKNLINSSYGRALKSIREDEVAAEAMGVNLFYHKVLSFAVGAFFAGIAGALLGSLVMTIDPNLFSFFMTFQIIIIVVVGGLGSITGTVIVGTAFAILMEVLRSVESPMSFFGLNIPGIPGMRMLLFSILLMIVILFFHQGLMGTKELSWKWLYHKLIRNRKEIKEGS